MWKNGNSWNAKNYITVIIYITYHVYIRLNKVIVIVIVIVK